MKKNIWIKAYTKVNLGDDLFIQILCQRYEKHHFHLYAPKKYKKIFSHVSNLTVYSFGYSWIDFLGKIFHQLGTKNWIKSSIQNHIMRKCDAIVIIGGSMFIQTGLTKKRMRVKLCYDRELLHYGKPVFLIGSNFGPYTDEEFYQEYQTIFAQYQDVCFREDYSYSLFKQLTNVRMASDVIFNCEYDNPSIHKQNNRILISVIDLERKKDLCHLTSLYERKIIDFMQSAIRKGYLITLMSFCRAEGDQIAIERILKSEQLQGFLPQIQVYHYDGKIQEALDQIVKVDKVIATRFHSMILGYVFQKKVFTLSYSKKTMNVLKDLKLESHGIEIEQLAELREEEIEKRWDEQEVVMSSLSKIKKNAGLQFKGLEQFLGEENEQI